MIDTPTRIQEEILHHPLNMGIEYDPDPHIYTRYHDDGSSEIYNGVTSLIKRYSPFEAQKIKYGIIHSKKPEYAHLNTLEDVEAEWETARAEGTEMHDELESWGNTGYTPEKPAAQKAVKYLDDHGLTPIIFEHTFYCDILKRATPMDLGLVDKYGRFVPADYKTSKEIRHVPYVYNNVAKMMEYPLTHLPTSNFFGYSLQLAFTKKWMEKYNFSFPICPWGLIFHVRAGELQVYRTLPMQIEVEKVYEWEAKTN